MGFFFGFGFKVGLLMMFAAILKMGAESIVNPSKVVFFIFVVFVGFETLGN